MIPQSTLIFYALFPLFLLFCISQTTFSTKRIRISSDQEEVLPPVLRNSTFFVSHHLGTKSPYWNPSHDEQITTRPAASRTAAPHQCTPIHFNYVARHGSREPTVNDVTKFLALQALLNKNKDAITNPEFSWLKVLPVEYYNIHI